MAILCTFPGRYGDLLWALPTLRALARRTGEAVDLLIAGEFASILPLLVGQPYVGKGRADHAWVMGDTQEKNRPQVPPGYDQVFHLGYPSWPDRPLPYYTCEIYNQQILNASPSQPYLLPEELDLSTPWITLNAPPTIHKATNSFIAGFAETYCELKMGVLFALGNHATLNRLIDVLVVPGGRYDREWFGPNAVDYRLHRQPSTDWLVTAWLIEQAELCLCCNSGLHVLAAALGTPVVMIEPMEARWDPIFYPLGRTGPQITLVTGNDGRPTWDARHVADTITAVLSRRSDHARTD